MRTITTPAAIPLADLGPPNLQTSSSAQYRTLTNAGVPTDFSYHKRIDNIKVGAVVARTLTVDKYRARIRTLGASQHEETLVRVSACAGQPKHRGALPHREGGGLR
jgi:hypothetical protein